MKGTINAVDFADVVEKALKESIPGLQTLKLPVADGGDYTGEVLRTALGSKIISTEVIAPLGKKVDANFFVSGTTAIIEMADASGMKLVEQADLNPMKASSFGTGQLIVKALDEGCTEILLAIGGSATVDGGIGMIEAMGFQLFDKNGNLLKGIGKNLLNVKTIRNPGFQQNFSIKIISDVDNPLLGESGAARVFGPQKGATPEMVTELENGLKNWSEIIQIETGKDFSKTKGSGAAGGIALPLLAFFDAEMVPGADFVLSKLNFDIHLKWADLVITGEGKLDTQTLNNKAPYAVAMRAKKYNKPVYAIAGIAELGLENVFDKIFTLTEESGNREEAIKNAQKYLYLAAGRLARSLVVTE